MKVLLKVILTVLILTLSQPVQAKEPVLGVSYMDYVYRDEAMVVTYPNDTVFVISDYRDTQLEPYKEPPLVKKEDFSKPIISLKVTSEPAQTQQSSKLKAQDFKEYVVYFDFDSYRIRPGELDKIKSIPKTESMVADVYGFTCKIGSSQYNLKLSRKRAQAVARALQKQGIPVGEVKGMGITRESKTLKLNRKAVIKISQ